MNGEKIRKAGGDCIGICNEEHYLYINGKQ